jgi:hypothetical protein
MCNYNFTAASTQCRNKCGAYLDTGMDMRWPDTCSFPVIILNVGIMDKQRQEISTQEKEQAASRPPGNEAAGSGEFENTSGPREQSIDADTAPVEPDLDMSRIEKFKEDADLDRVR